MKKILVPTDFTATADNVLRYAAKLAQKAGAELVLLHCMDLPSLTSTQQSLTIQKLRSHTERVLSRAGASVQNIHYDCLVRPGKLPLNLQELVRNYAADLIVMGAERVDEPDALSQDHAAYLMDKVNCPLLVVPPQAELKRLDNIVFATDFSDRDPEVIRAIVNFARIFKAELLFVQVYGEENRHELLHLKQAMNETRKLVTYKRASFHLLEEEDVLEGVNEFAERNEADMLVLATRDSFLMQRLFHKNYVKTLAYHTRIPLLNYYQNKKKPCSGCCGNCKSKQNQGQEQIVRQIQDLV